MATNEQPTTAAVLRQRGDLVVSLQCPLSQCRGLAARDPAMIRIDAIWSPPSRGTCAQAWRQVLARVVKVFGAAHPHHAYGCAEKTAPGHRQKSGRGWSTNHLVAASACDVVTWSPDAGTGGRRSLRGAG